MVPNAPLEGTVLVTEELDHEEIKNHIKSALRSVPSDATVTPRVLQFLINLPCHHIALQSIHD
jgi:hypothetical protein